MSLHNLHPICDLCRGCGEPHCGFTISHICTYSNTGLNGTYKTHTPTFDIHLYAKATLFIVQAK